jgi:hypothetical protein
VSVDATSWPGKTYRLWLHEMRLLLPPTLYLLRLQPDRLHDQPGDAKLFLRPDELPDGGRPCAARRQGRVAFNEAVEAFT